VRRFPADLGRFLNRLGGEFRDCVIEKNIGAGSLEGDYLRVDVGSRGS
jgi:hypothetical protein